MNDVVGAHELKVVVRGQLEGAEDVLKELAVLARADQLRPRPKGCKGADHRREP